MRGSQCLPVFTASTDRIPGRCPGDAGQSQPTQLFKFSGLNGDARSTRARWIMPEEISITIPLKEITEAAAVAFALHFRNGYGTDVGPGFQLIKRRVALIVTEDMVEPFIRDAIARLLPGIVDAATGEHMKKYVAKRMKAIAESGELDAEAEKLFGDAK